MVLVRIPQNILVSVKGEKNIDFDRGFSKCIGLSEGIPKYSGSRDTQDTTGFLVRVHNGLSKGSPKCNGFS